MRFILFVAAAFFLFPETTEAKSRTWKSRNGQEVKGEFTGVLNGRVVLKLPGNRRQQVRLSDFSLEDRDYLVDLLQTRGRKTDKDHLLQLIQFENTAAQPIDPDVVRTTNDGVSDPNDPGNQFPANPGNLGNPAAPATVDTEMYGLPLPSPPLLVEDSVREWTSLLGQKLLFRFDRVLAPGFLRLKRADGTEMSFAIVNFSKADIEYVQETLEKDWERPVFPDNGGFQSLTPEDASNGYRVWKDRKDVPLVGKLVSLTGDDVTLEVAGANQNYPLAGLSASDRSWVKEELRRRAEAAAQAARDRMEAQRNERESMASRSSFGSRPSSSGQSFTNRDSSRWNNSGSGGSSRDSSSYRSGGMFEWKFRCSRCGHEWTNSISIDQCPQCRNQAQQNRTQSQGSGGSSYTSTPGPRYPTTTTTRTSPPTEADVSIDKASNIMMTLVYVGLGLGLLAGIAFGLFRAFG